MKLNVSDFRWILLNCNIMVGLYKGKQYAVIEPKFPKNQARLDFLLGSFSFPSIEEWNMISRQLSPKLKKVSQDLYNQSLNKLAGLSDEKLTNLNNKQRIELLDGLLQDVIGNDEFTFLQNQKTLAKHKEQLKILLYGIKLPPDFLKQELLRCEQFCNRLQGVENLKKYLESWSSPDHYQCRVLCHNILKVFNEIYHTSIILKFFSNHAEEARRPQNIYHKTYKAPTAYVEGKTIFINNEQLTCCHNLAIPALIFHQALHIARRQEDWSHFPLLDKLFEPKFTYLLTAENEFYNFNPVEMNAYKMTEEIIDFLRYKMDIKFIEKLCPTELYNVTNLSLDKPYILSD